MERAGNREDKITTEGAAKGYLPSEAFAKYFSLFIHVMMDYDLQYVCECVKNIKGYICKKKIIKIKFKLKFTNMQTKVKIN